MAIATAIRVYDYVNHSFDKVREALMSDSNRIFNQATMAAESRAESVAAGLHVKIAGIEFGKQVVIDVDGYANEEDSTRRKLTINLQWKAAEAAALFPTMSAELHVYPITATETQLDFNGQYEPPLGILGRAIDAFVGHRIAEASVHHFVTEVASYLRQQLD